MKLFSFLLLLIALASFVPATPGSLRETEAEVMFQPGRYAERHLGPQNEGEDVNFNRNYNEEGEPPVGRQIQISLEHPLAGSEDADTDTLKDPRVKMNMIVSCMTTAGLVASGTVTTDVTPTAAHIGAVATTTAKQKYGPTFFPWLSTLMVRARSRGWRCRRLLG